VDFREQGASRLPKGTKKRTSLCQLREYKDDDAGTLLVCEMHHQVLGDAICGEDVDEVQERVVGKATLDVFVCMAKRVGQLERLAFKTGNLSYCIVGPEGTS